ncbi:hepatocellular carcinoma-associated antigen 59-domain-containing protein [Papiliotrema laurentii]|uniref:Hepatocellular carcinoma-associated antigen 59-domain-containing protein n=1 Tax=Papiliotrema laurentii TaxID=5418 RepID=A0AAD9FRI2_PAPLA|nr:hepatocellular carcinoma-associated antigen 59-domain-containing protein [Papiliotrema laurentii]
MFKKRSRPASVRDKSATVEEEDKGRSDREDTAKTEQDGQAEDEEVGQSIEELILLRKLRKSKQGIDLEKLNRGEDKRKAKKKEPEIDMSKYGLHPSTKKTDEHSEFEDEKERLKRLVRNNNFTQQTNALDVDKHMLAYIEREMEKRRGQAAQAEAEGRPEPFDMEAELYRLAERYKLDMEEKKAGIDDEGDVTNSMGMLTSIPEVDLGMENRLKNIEETEKAKREMMQARQTNPGAPRKGPADEDFAASRFFSGSHRVIASDSSAINIARREASGLPPTNRGPRERAPETSTDDQVYERFKKR